MKTTLLKLTTTLLTICSLQHATAQVLFTDDFEGGLGNWPVVAGTFDLSSAQNIVPVGGSSSALLDNSADRVYHNLGSELSGPFVLSYYLFDDTATRAFAETRSYTGVGWNDGTLVQLLAAGKYNTVTLPGEVFDGTVYQARVTFGANAGWFNLNAPGVPTRSAGWHRFDIERLADGTTINFYVDGILGRTIAGATDASVDSLTLGFGAGTSAGNAYFDGVSLAVPEPSVLALLALGGLVLASRRTRRIA